MLIAMGWHYSALWGASWKVTVSLFEGLYLFIYGHLQVALRAENLQNYPLTYIQTSFLDLRVRELMVKKNVTVKQDKWLLVTTFGLLFGLTSLKKKLVVLWKLWNITPLIKASWILFSRIKWMITNQIQNNQIIVIY